MVKVKQIMRWVLRFGLIYFLLSVLTALPYWGGDCMREELKYQRHEDHTPPWTKWIPCWATCFCLPTEGPRALLYSHGTEFVRMPSGGLAPKPIPQPGEWHVAAVKTVGPFFLPYVAYTTSTGWHMRLGMRWDDVDHFYIPSAALHRLC